MPIYKLKPRIGQSTKSGEESKEDTLESHNDSSDMPQLYPATEESSSGMPQLYPATEENASGMPQLYLANEEDSLGMPQLHLMPEQRRPGMSPHYSGSREYTAQKYSSIGLPKKRNIDDREISSESDAEGREPFEDILKELPGVCDIKRIKTSKLSVIRDSSSDTEEDTPSEDILAGFPGGRDNDRIRTINTVRHGNETADSQTQQEINQTELHREKGIEKVLTVDVARVKSKERLPEENDKNFARRLVKNTDMGITEIANITGVGFKAIANLPEYKLRQQRLKQIATEKRKKSESLLKTGSFTIEQIANLLGVSNTFVRNTPGFEQYDRKTKSGYTSRKALSSYEITGRDNKISKVRMVGGAGQVNTRTSANSISNEQSNINLPDDEARAIEMTRLSNHNRLSGEDDKNFASRLLEHTPLSLRKIEELTGVGRTRVMKRLPGYKIRAQLYAERKAALHAKKKIAQPLLLAAQLPLKKIADISGVAELTMRHMDEYKIYVNKHEIPECVKKSINTKQRRNDATRKTTTCVTEDVTMKREGAEKVRSEVFKFENIKEMVSEAHGLLPRGYRTSTTTAIGVDGEGNCYISNSEPNFSKLYANWASEHGGVKIVTGKGHAESKIIMNIAGIKHIDASRHICIDCETMMRDKGITTFTMASGAKSFRERMQLKRSGASKVKLGKDAMSASKKNSRQIVLDIETTGLGKYDRIIEIGCVEILDGTVSGNTYHSLIQTNHVIDAASGKVHGITQEDLHGKPRFSDIAEDFLKYIGDAELIAHNAQFEKRMLAQELTKLGYDPEILITDTMAIAKNLSPHGHSYKLSALCDDFGIDRSHYTVHRALDDAKLLAELYLKMTKPTVTATSPFSPQFSKDQCTGKPYTEKNVADAKQFLTEGNLSLTEISVRTGMNKSTMVSWPEHKTWKELQTAIKACDPRKAEAVKMSQQGISQKKIAEKLKASKTKICQWIKESMPSENISPESSSDSGKRTTTRQGLSNTTRTHMQSSLQHEIIAESGIVNQQGLLRWLQEPGMDQHSYHDILDVLEDEEIDFDINDFINAWGAIGRPLPD